MDVNARQKHGILSRSKREERPVEEHSGHKHGKHKSTPKTEERTIQTYKLVLKTADKSTPKKEEKIVEDHSGHKEGSYKTTDKSTPKKEERTQSKTSDKAKDDRVKESVKAKEIKSKTSDKAKDDRVKESVKSKEIKSKTSDKAKDDRAKESAKPRGTKRKTSDSAKDVKGKTSGHSKDENKTNEDKSKKQKASSKSRAKANRKGERKEEQIRYLFQQQDMLLEAELSGKIIRRSDVQHVIDVANSEKREYVTKRDEKLAKLLSTIVAGLPVKHVTPNMVEQWLKMALADLEKISVILVPKHKHIIKDLIERRISKQNENSRMVLEKKEKSFKKMASQYSICFDRFIDDDTCVSFATTSMDSIRRLTLRDYYILKYFVDLTCRRANRDGLLQLCISGETTVGKSTLFENPLIDVSHLPAREQGVGRFDMGNKTVVLFNDVSLMDVVIGKDSDLMKKLLRGEQCSTKVQGTQRSTDAVHVFMSANERLHTHKVKIGPNDKSNSLEKMISGKTVTYTESLAPILERYHYKHKSPSVKAIQRRYLEMFVRSRPKLPKRILDREPYWVNAHAIIGVFERVLGILEQYKRSKFRGENLYLYVLFGLCGYFQMFEDIMHRPAKTRVVALINKYCVGYMIKVLNRCLEFPYLDYRLTEWYQKESDPDFCDSTDTETEERDSESDEDDKDKTPENYPNEDSVEEDSDQKDETDDDSIVQTDAESDQNEYETEAGSDQNESEAEESDQSEDERNAKAKLDALIKQLETDSESDEYVDKRSSSVSKSSSSDSESGSNDDGRKKKKFRHVKRRATTATKQDKKTSSHSDDSTERRTKPNLEKQAKDDVGLDSESETSQSDDSTERRTKPNLEKQAKDDFGLDSDSEMEEPHFGSKSDDGKSDVEASSDSTLGDPPMKKPKMDLNRDSYDSDASQRSYGSTEDFFNSGRQSRGTENVFDGQSVLAEEGGNQSSRGAGDIVDRQWDQTGHDDIQFDGQSVLAEVGGNQFSRGAGDIVDMQWDQTGHGDIQALYQVGQEINLANVDVTGTNVGDDGNLYAQLEEYNSNWFTYN